MNLALPSDDLLPGTYCFSLWVLFKKLHAAGKEVGEPVIVGIQESHKLPLSQPETMVASHAGAPVFLEAVRYPVAVFAEDLCRPVRGTVVYNDDLMVRYDFAVIRFPDNVRGKLQH